MPVSNLKAAVTGKQPLLPLQTEPTSTPPKSTLKAVFISAATLLGAAGFYCASKVLGSSGVEHALTAEKVDKVGLDISHIGIQTRGITPTTTPFANQQANPGSLYQSVGHAFFTSNEWVLHRVSPYAPSWVSCQSYPLLVSSCLITIGSAIPFPQVLQVAGNIAFIADETSGLQLINVTNPKKLIVMQPYNTAVGSTNGVQVVGKTAYVVGALGLQILDISNPSTPAPLVSYPIAGGVFAIQVVGKTAYVLNSTALKIINIGNPNIPTSLGSYPIPGGPVAVQVTGTTAFVTDVSNGLQIINIANPHSPALFITYPLVGALGIQVVGKIAFVTTGNVLQFIDITTVSSPILLGSCTVPYSFPIQVIKPVALSATQFIVYAGGTSSLSIIVVSDEGCMEDLCCNAFQFNNIPAYAIQVINSTAYVATSDPLSQINSFQILNLNAITLSGTPSISDQGDFDIEILGTTSQGSIVSSFHLRVGHPPSIILAIPQVIAKLNQNLNYTFDSSTFFDNYNPLIYSVTPLPAWCRFNSYTQTLSGTPKVTDIATLSLNYLANNTYFPPSRIPFQLKVEAPPVLVTPLKDKAYPRNTLFNFNLPQNTFIDPNNDTLIYSTSSLPSWLTCSNNGFCTGTSTLGKFNITLIANDGFGGTASASFRLLVTEQLPSMLAVAGSKATYKIPNSAFANIGGNITKYSSTQADGTPLPSWLQFDNATQIFTAVPPESFSILQLQVSATNTLHETFSQVFDINVANSFSPVYKNPISDQQANVGVLFNYTMPNNVFEDPNDPNGNNFNRLTYEAIGLPSWLTFYKMRREFSGIPTRADTNTFAVRTTTISVVANNGQVNGTGKFNIAVSGESYGALAIKIIAPLVSTPATLWGFYKKRAVLLNLMHKKKYTKDNVTLVPGQPLTYQFSCDSHKISEVVLQRIATVGCKTRIYHTLGMKNWTKVPDTSNWIMFNAGAGTVSSIEGVPSLGILGPVRIQAIGNANVILEQFEIQIAENRAETFLQPNLDRTSWDGATDMVPLTSMRHGLLETVSASEPDATLIVEYQEA